MNIEIMGPRGSGKSTLATQLEQRLSIPYVSLGNIARREVENRTSLGKEIVYYTQKNEPYPPGFLVPIISKELEKVLHKRNCFILDGYPRRDSEAIELVEILKNLHAKLNCVISLDLSRENTHSRVNKRYYCPKCGYQGVKTACTCTLGASILLERRQDDTKDIIDKAYDEYLLQKDKILGILSASFSLSIFNMNAEAPPNFLVSSALHLLAELNNNQLE